MVNVYKSCKINKSDSINENNAIFNLDDRNILNKKLILIYIYRLPKFPTHGYKVGMATCHPGEIFWNAIKKRIVEQSHELALSDEQLQKYGNDREVVYWGVCLDAYNESFKDYHVHNKIKHLLAGLVIKDREWFNGVPLDDLIEAFNKCRATKDENKIYTPRKEQRLGINKLTEYFKKYPNGKRFLLNCKMRFGKCYTTYKFCEENNINRILILTFVPAVEESWEEDLNHIEKHYDYFTDDDLKKPSFNLNGQENPYVIFLSLQNYLGKDSTSKETKDKIKKLQNIDFDLVVLDEYHFGAWNDRTQETLEDFEPDYAKAIKNGAGNQDILKKFEIKTKKTICLSGTPFKALARGEFNDENTYTYSYFDEQKNKYPDYEKENYKDNVNKDYAIFPDMQIFGYNMSRLFKGLSIECMSNVKILNKSFFSLNKFFETKKESNETLSNTFVYEEEIKEWLEIIKGRSTFGGDFPYSNNRMRDNNKHTLWLMPTVKSCEAISKLLEEDEYFSRYLIVNLSAQDVGTGQKALDYLNLKIKESENTNKLGTIAITVNKLTIGVTVKPWMSVFVLKDLASPESYFQSIFRIQTPWVENEKILKTNGFVYDFNMDRAAALILKFAEQSQDSSTTKMQICKLIVKYMPIYMNGDMSTPISYDTFFLLATYGDTKGISLSKKIKDISKTTRTADDDVISCMLNDREVSDIIKHVFAHAKFPKTKERTRVNEPIPGFLDEAFKKGNEAGYKQGSNDYELFIDFDDATIQQEFDNKLKQLIKENTPIEYDSDKKTYYSNGYKKGYEAGVNAPIKKLQCGKDDGIKFAKELKKKYGEYFYYEGSNKQIIDKAVVDHLNKIENIPEEYKNKSLYTRWYKESFRKAVRNNLRRPKSPDEGQSIEDANNVIQHLISRLFEFLYISVYRETTFKEIFNNANPEVFLEAVGITKDDFETLNRYHVFQEDVLNNYIHEFFVNESLGSILNHEDEIVKENYRNSFDWFGFSKINEDLVKSIHEYEANIHTEKIKESVVEYSNSLKTEVKGEPIKSEENKNEEKETVKEKAVEMVLPNGLSEIEKKVYTAIWNITSLEKEIHCRPYKKTIKKYLVGDSSSAYYPSFNGKPCCGSMGFFEAFKIEKTLKLLVNKGVIKLVNGKMDIYYPS